MAKQSNNLLKFLEEALRGEDVTRAAALRALRSRAILTDDMVEQLHRIQTARVDIARAQDELKEARAAEKSAVNALLDLETKWANDDDLATMAERETEFLQEKAKMSAETIAILDGKAPIGDASAKALAEAIELEKRYGNSPGRFNADRMAQIRARSRGETIVLPEKVPDANGKPVAAKKVKPQPKGRSSKGKAGADAQEAPTARVLDHQPMPAAM